jgi:hypothetical protein
MDNGFMKKRELELARNLADMMKSMPSDIFRRFQYAIIALNTTSTPDLKFIDVEVQKIPNDKSDLDRLDIVVPLSLDKYTEIIFELKLHHEDMKQVERYAASRSNALIVSLAESFNNSSYNYNNIVRISWKDFFWGLSGLLTLDGLDRVLKSDTRKYDSSFYIELPDHHKPLGETFNRYLEDFLYAIKHYARDKKDRVMVVTGKNAVDTATKDNIYYCPSNWDSDFGWLVIVYQSSLQYIGKVTHRLNPALYCKNYPTNLIEITNVCGSLNKNNSNLINRLDSTVHNYQHANDGLIVWMDSSNSIKSSENNKSNNNENEFNSMVELKCTEYHQKGAFTMSHRYFDSFDDFFKAFCGENK